jgi:hypothetical protein
MDIHHRPRNWYIPRMRRIHWTHHDEQQPLVRVRVSRYCTKCVYEILLTLYPRFKLQICALVLGPSFVAAAIYLTLKHFVLYCGPQYSLIKARLYPWIFVGCDFGSMVLQGIGGGLAAAGGTKNQALINGGNKMIVAGIAFQVVTMAVCGLLVLIYIIRYKKGAAARTAVEEKSAYHSDKEQGSIALWKIKVFGGMVTLAYFTVLIRCIYRLPEMAGGWGNALMRNEKEFLLLDGM